MVTKFFPDIAKVYFVNQYTLFHILEGSGSIEVDFKNYRDWQDKAIYLEEGQYIKFFSDDFVVRKIEFPNKIIFENKEVRVLFKHLISLGYIDFNDCEDCRKYLSDSVFSKDTSQIIDISSNQWYWQNPFSASKAEYQIIFDAKDIVDQEFQNHLSNSDLRNLMKENGRVVNALMKSKLGVSFKNMLSKKRLLESQKEIAFTDKSIQEVSYEMGYKDAAYFNRVFKNSTGSTPIQFRKDFDFEQRDRFAQNIIELIKNHHATHRTLDFYANKMHLSIKALSKKTREKMNTSIGQLIRNELIYTSKKMLDKATPIREIALNLGFEEANHFSQFFKKYTDNTPSQYRARKYNS